MSHFRTIRRLALAALIVVGAGAPAGTAQAGEYRVHLCATPAGHHVPMDSMIGDQNTLNGGAYDHCDGETPIAAGVELRTGSDPGGGAWGIVPTPAYVRMVDVSLVRRVTIGAGTGPVRWTLRAYDPSAPDGGTAIEECRSAAGCTSLDWPSGSSVTHTFGGSGGRGVKWEVACETGSPSSCGQNWPDYGRDIQGQVLRLATTLRETTLPDGAAAGPATQLGIDHVGVEQANLSATDFGAGVYQAFARLDDTEVGRVTAGDAACRDAGNDPTTDLDFERLVPCPEVVPAPWVLPVDTRLVANGQRRLRITIRDAAGNERQIYDQVITVANPPAGPLPTAGGSAGPTTTGPLVTPVPTAASAAPEGRVVLARLDARSLRRGAAAKVVGTVVRPSGEPIAGAVVVASQRLRAANAPWLPLATVRTDAAGAFSVAVPTDASRDVRVDYAHGAGVASAETSLAVRAQLTLTPAAQRIPLFGRLKLSGRVGVAGLPKRGAYVELQLRDGKGWRTVATVRTDASGDWRWTYRLSSGRRASYSFRARLRPAADVPSAASTSRTVRVTVR